MENKSIDMADHVKYIDESNVKLEDKFLLEGEPWLVSASGANISI